MQQKTIIYRSFTLINKKARQLYRSWMIAENNIIFLSYLLSGVYGLIII